MKAKLLPLGEEKYYGTYVDVVDGKHAWQICLWDHNGREPSDRELRGACTIEQWRRNDVITIKDQYGTDKILAKDYFEICDTHFESRETHALALKICECLNRSGIC